MFQRGFAHRAFEDKYLVGQSERFAMAEVELQLSGPLFVNQGVDVQMHVFAPIIDVLNDWIEFVGRIDAEALPTAFLAAGPTDRWLQRNIRIGAAFGEIKFNLWRNDGQPAFVFIEL